MEFPLTINDQRVCAVFPAIGNAGTDFAYMRDFVAVTTNDESGKDQRFTLVRCELDGTGNYTPDSRYPNTVYFTFPAALLAARKSQGWG